ncbi:YdcF family protein [Sinorhizobium fredii]|nr:YdcF family protein [Sinorhizobium fredii]GEC35749.1 hypothetical protein EFR01_59200 [Sinorhizobium fredii]GLS06827.1 hypothetical protein GCM10007864_04520 [Sinorhizobium fredii]
MRQAEKFDAVVVLANLMDAQGVLNDESRERMATAVRALKAGMAPLILACGWPYRDDSDLAIADAMASFATEELQVDSDKVLVERTSRDTVGDAVFSKRNFAIPFGWKRILTVTSSYHQARTLAIFSFVYGPSFHVVVKGAKSDTNASFAASEAKSLAAFHSTFNGIEAGDDVAILDRLRTAHPFYNGAIYSPI